MILDRTDVSKATTSLFGFVDGGGDGGGGIVRETVEQVMLPPRRGDTVTIKGGALGSYIATSPGRRSARVRRIR